MSVDSESRRRRAPPITIAAATTSVACALGTGRFRRWNRQIAGILSNQRAGLTAYNLLIPVVKEFWTIADGRVAPVDLGPHTRLAVVCRMPLHRARSICLAFAEDAGLVTRRPGVNALGIAPPNMLPFADVWEWWRWRGLGRVVGGIGYRALATTPTLMLSP
ncbi:hypothetical protein C8J57DRAFT_1512981 [Mycena rebaudengoi]|nr:hypothetical protein C8J57DRAFT_1512981 [Mycena rebaudengoi]